MDKTSGLNITKMAKKLGGKLKNMYPTTFLPKNLTKRELSIPAFKHTRFSKANLIIFAVVFGAIGAYALFTSLAASLPSVYVAQTQAGLNDGSSCANAHAASFFNTVGNWGAGSTQIGPGTIVHLCGTISSTLTAQGNGASGSPITILFEPAAKISQQVCGSCMNLNNRSFMIVDGGTNGIVEATDNGTSLGHQQNSTGISANPCNDCEIKNLLIQNIYVHTGNIADPQIDQTQLHAINFNGSNVSIHDNVIHDVGWAITYGENGQHDVKIYNNNLYNMDHGIVPSFGGGSAGPYWIYGNHFHDFANWDNASNSWHHDGIHCYTVNAQGTGEHISDMYIYNNTFDGDIGGNETAWIFMEGGSGPGRTPCSDSTSNFWFFNNFGVVSQDSNNGVFAFNTGQDHIYNNTMVGHSTAAGTNFDCCGVTSSIQNNVMSTSNQFTGTGTGTGANGVIDYNIYANGNPNGNGWYCNGFIGTFAAWKTCSGGDSHGQFINDAKLSASGVPQAGSPVIGTGANLTSLCTGNLAPLCSDINGNPRPAAGAWDAGAVEVTPAANVWVSTGGNDATCVRGDQTKPCLSLNKAFTIAQCSDIVAVAAGNYADQTISAAKACSSSTQVKFVPAAGAQPVFNNVTVQTSYVWIEGMKVPHSLAGTTVGNWTVAAPSPQLPSAVSYITLKNDEGGGMYIYGEHVDVLGGSYGGFSACLTGQEDLTRIWQQSDSSSNYYASSYVTFDGVTIHDGTDNGNECADPVNGPHVDALQILGGHHITIQNSFFYNCPTDCIIGSGFRTGEDNYLIQNNFFQKEEHPGATLNFSYSSPGDPDTGASMVIRYNTTNGAIATGCTATSSSCWDVYGNIAGSGGCTRATWTYNVVADGSCTGGTGNKTGTPSFVGPTPQGSYGSATIPNFHLAANDTLALGAGDPARYPSFDFDSDFRPQGTGPEAGADELATGGVATPTVNISASPTSITSGGSSTLTWSSANATSCTASGAWSGSKATSGSQSVSPVATSTYNLSCSGAGGSANALASVNVAAVGDFNIGETNVLSTGDNGNGNLLLAQSATLGQTGTIKSISFYVTSAAGNLRLGIYDATGPGGGPGALKAQTAELTPIAGWNTAAVTSQISLNAGTYWLAYLPSSSSLSFVKATDASSSGKLYSFAYGTLPGTFSTSPSSTASHWSLYATLNSGGSSAPGDLNSDGHVNVIDLSILLSHFAQSATPSQGDINNDGIVNIFDLSILLSHYGT